MQRKLIRVARQNLKRYNRFRKRIREWQLYRRAVKKSRQSTGAFDKLHTFALFIGHGRSGSTLFGRLLDAHPNAIIAHELDTLRYIEQGVSETLLYHLLLEKSQEFLQRGNEWSGYSYSVNGQIQGGFRELQVIGDKRTGDTLRHLARKPELLQQLRQTLRPEIKIKVLHIIRNPFDNISTMAYRNRTNNLAPFIEKYFANCATALKFHDALNQDGLIRLRLEDLIHSPERVLRNLCAFLNLDCSDEYVRACCERIFPYPKKTRYIVVWTRERIRQVNDEIARYPFLQGYTFDS